MPRSGCAAWETTGFDGVYKYNRAWRTDDTAWRCSLDSQEEGGRLTKACAKPPTLFVRRCTRPDGWRVLRIGPIRAQGQDTKQGRIVLIALHAPRIQFHQPVQLAPLFDSL